MSSGESASLRLGYVPQLLPSDADGFNATGSWAAAMIGAPQVVNPGTRAFCRAVRERTELLLVDPRTAIFQFEGYMSMEEARAVPYSPGRGTLGSLWQPRDFATPEARRSLIDGVFELQVGAGAGLLLAPYFAIPQADHPWLEIAACCAREALERAPAAAGLVLQIDLDGLIAAGAERIVERFAGLDPALVVLIVTDFDETLASPAEARAVLQLVRAFCATGAPVMPAYTGRFGLVAIAAGACALAGGGLELETHPRRYLREGLVNLKANAHYLPGAMIRQPVREADAMIEAVPQIAGGGVARPSRQVHRRRLAFALESKRREAAELLAEADAMAQLRWRLRSALDQCRRAADLCDQADATIPAGSYHYLEVLLELAGGPAATIPADTSF